MEVMFAHLQNGSIALTLLAVLATTVYLLLTRAHVKTYEVPPPRPFDSEGIEALEGVIRCHDPCTGRLLALVTPDTPKSIDECVRAAAAAQTSWSGTSFSQRRAVLRSLLRHVLTNARDICRVAALDSGKTLVDAQLGEVLVTVEKLQWTIKHGERALRPSRRPTNLLMAYKRNTVRYEPLGVVAALVSWNYPFHNLIGPVISAIFAGNGVVVKVSEHTAWSAPYFLSIIRGALSAHGHDPLLVQVVVCLPDAAEHLTSHPAISHITFIGSRPVAHKVALAASKTLVPLVLELGGKDPFIVLESARPDLPRIAEVILRGTFQASGQNCIGIERVISSGATYDALVTLLEPRVKALRLGPDADVGAMISSSSFPRLEALIQDAVSQGARLLAGGSPYTHPDHPAGTYFSPTLLVDVTPDMRIANEECFAPILSLMRAPTSSPGDILHVANNPNFGLGASIHAHESDPFLQPIIKGLKAGMVAVNDFGVYYAVQLPFGGVAGSGYGRFAGEEGLRALCNIKAVCEDRFGPLGLRTSIPPVVRYPVAGQERAWQFTQGVVEIGYGDAPTKASGLHKIFKNM